VAGSERLRVMTWNLWWRFGDAWRERGREIVSTLKTVRPDVAGLQEAWGTSETTQAELLAGELDLHSAYGAPSLPPPPSPPDTPDQAGVEVGVAVLSRWPILDIEQHRLPSGHRPEVVVLATVIDHPHGPLHAVTSCLDWEPEPAAKRLTQARALAELVTDSSRDGHLPVILTGDLNAPPASAEVGVLTDVMVDAWVAARGVGDAGHTMSASNPFSPREAPQFDQRIDYVLARAGRPEQPVVVERASLAGDRPPDGLHPSDHYAVVADFRV
jgi:endonuclease/exonuclease/phosphatase family metal-dependent hydrolase